jgi:hypothetical protein
MNIKNKPLVQVRFGLNWARWMQKNK